MPKVKEYRMVAAMVVARLIELIAERIRDGWQPIGGVSVNTDGDGDVWLYQAMVKYE